MYGGGMLGTQDRHTITGMLTWEQPHCQPFRDLIAHPKLIPYLNIVFGHGWRMDSEPLPIASAKGAGGHGLHGCTNRHFNPSYYYTCANGEIRAGQTVFQLQLRDIEPGHGGLAVIHLGRNRSTHGQIDVQHLELAARPRLRRFFRV